MWKEETRPCFNEADEKGSEKMNITESIEGFNRGIQTQPGSLSKRLIHMIDKVALFCFGKICQPSRKRNVHFLEKRML